MKNCKYCNEYMCGASGTEQVSKYCGVKGKWIEDDDDEIWTIIWREQDSTNGLNRMVMLKPHGTGVLSRNEVNQNEQTNRRPRKHVR
jgi:hypothetical protein